MAFIHLAHQYETFYLARARVEIIAFLGFLRVDEWRSINFKI